jgi:hypothetical protein
MVNNTYTNLDSPKVRSLFKSWNFWKPFIAVFVGAMIGFAYSYYVSCDSGNCGVTHNTFMSAVWGGLFGLFLVLSPCARGRC